MGKIKALTGKARTELNRLALEAYTGEFTLTRTDRIVFISLAVMTILFFAASMTFATGFFDAIDAKFWDYYKQFAGMATIVALLSITIGILWIMLSPSSKSSATPISWIKKVFLCYFLLMIIGGVFGVINDLTAGYGWETMGK